MLAQTRIRIIQRCVGACRLAWTLAGTLDALSKTPSPRILALKLALLQVPVLMDDPVVEKISKKLGKDKGQVR